MSILTLHDCLSSLVLQPTQGQDTEAIQEECNSLRKERDRLAEQLRNAAPETPIANQTAELEARTQERDELSNELMVLAAEAQADQERLVQERNNLMQVMIV